MKKEIFEKYVDFVCKIYLIERDELFSMSASRMAKDARQLFCYLCYVRPCRFKFLKDYLWENGCKIHPPAIFNGIRKAELRIDEDADLKRVVRMMTERIQYDYAD